MATYRVVTKVATASIKLYEVCRLLKRLSNSKSEIPCRVSNIAPVKSDLNQQTGSNRWSPSDTVQDIVGNTEGKILESDHIHSTVSP